MPTWWLMKSQIDTIVIGVGGMGSATCHELARRGQRVLGLDRFPLVHDRGSSHGESRIIRKAYFEHPDYVPLLHRAYDLWFELEKATKRTLFHPTGLLLSGPAAGETIQGARHAAALHDLELQNLSLTEARRRFPGFDFPSDHDIAFEPGAGTLFVDACVQAHVDEAIRLGASLHGNEPVVDWNTDGKTVHVRTATAKYSASHLVVTAGAWANDLLSSAGLDLQVLRKFVGWFPIRSQNYLATSGFPDFYFELPGSAFYGFPSFDGTTLKVAEHSRGEPVLDPANVDRECHPSDLERLVPFVKSFLPGVGLDLVRHSVCMYTMSHDHHFVIDVDPRWKNVIFAAGFSGHGFKFCPVVGEALADLVQHGSTQLPIGFLSRSRGNS